MIFFDSENYLDRFHQEYTEKSPYWPQEFDRTGFQDRYVETNELLMARHFNTIPPEVDRFIDTNSNFYGEEIEENNKVQGPVGSKSMDDFRSSNLKAESFCVSPRVKAKSSLTSRTQACLFWAVQSGYTCLLRAIHHQPPSHLGVCRICQEGIDKILLEPDNPIFREDLILPINHRIAETEDGDNYEPRDVMKQRELLKAARNNAEAYKGTQCHKDHLKKVAEREYLLKHSLKKHEMQKAEARKNRELILKADYLRSCYGDSEQIRELLFLLSSLCLTPEKLKFIALIVNAATGCISYSITFEDPCDGVLKRIDFENVFVNCFKNMDEKDAFHAYFSGRGHFLTLQLFTVGAVTVLPLLYNTAASRAEKGLRREEKAKYGMRMSLASCARLELLKARRNSIFQDTARFTHGMNAVEFGETSFYASLSHIASHLQILTIEGEYGQYNENKKRERVFVPTPKPEPTPPMALAPRPTPEPEEDDDQIMRSRSQSPSDEIWEDQRMAELDIALDERAHKRKQSLSLRNHDENEGFYKFVYEPDPAYQTPQINVKNGKFEDFLREWNRTADLPVDHQVYHRRQLCKFFKPVIQPVVGLETSLWNFVSYNLYEY